MRKVHRSAYKPAAVSTEFRRGTLTVEIPTRIIITVIRASIDVDGSVGNGHIAIDIESSGERNEAQRRLAEMEPIAVMKESPGCGT